ncbi:MAG TPA: LPP20 family lipoprotein [Polyangia bacterium]
MSHRNLFSLISGSLALALVGCGSSPPKPQNALQAELVGAPKWASGACQLGLQNKKGICGTGSVSGMTNVSLARSAAEGRARTELARSLQTKVKAMLKDYQAATQGGPGNKTASEQHIEDVSKQITDTTLSGTRLEDTWISNAGTFWALVVLDTDAFKDSMSNMKQLDERMRAAIVQRADKAFDELDNATAP